MSGYLKTRGIGSSSVNWGRGAISFLIIDGYNLIGIHHTDLRRQRELLVESLIGYRKRKGHDITVVFDGWKTGEGKENRSVVGGITVIYTRIGENADAVIKRIVAAKKREWLVVTSDRDIANFVWAAGSVPLPADAFLAFLERKRDPYSEYSGEEMPDEEYPEHQRKGNPRQPSKKEKAVMRALRKL